MDRNLTTRKSVTKIEIVDPNEEHKRRLEALMREKGLGSNRSDAEPSPKADDSQRSRSNSISAKGAKKQRPSAVSIPQNSNSTSSEPNTPAEGSTSNTKRKKSEATNLLKKTLDELPKVEEKIASKKKQPANPSQIERRPSAKTLLKRPSTENLYGMGPKQKSFENMVPGLGPKQKSFENIVYDSNWQQKDAWEELLESERALKEKRKSSMAALLTPEEAQATTMPIETRSENPPQKDEVINIVECVTIESEKIKEEVVVSETSVVDQSNSSVNSGTTSIDTKSTSTTTETTKGPSLSTIGLLSSALLSMYYGAETERRIVAEESLNLAKNELIPQKPEGVKRNSLSKATSHRQLIQPTTTTTTSL